MAGAAVVVVEVVEGVEVVAAGVFIVVESVLVSFDVGFAQGSEAVGTPGVAGAAVLPIFAGPLGCCSAVSLMYMFRCCE